MFVLNFNILFLQNNELWKKSLLEEENVHTFYVETLSKFIKPYENNDLFLPHQNASKYVIINLYIIFCFHIPNS